MEIRRILIANRGAIAVRIIRSLTKMGIESVAVFHSDEKDSSYTRLATYAIDLGKGNLSETFLNIEKLVSIAKAYSCDAVHPGYGFLSENYLFAKACEENSVKFIGPKSTVIRLMGLKSKAKEVAFESKVPVLQSFPIAKAEDFDGSVFQFPVLIKAIAGGGGKGLRIVRNAEGLSDAINSAKREALQYFGNDELIIEPFVEDARHIEVQILGNEHGEIIHLFERECSIQRNHQKIIEEAPAPDLPEELKEKLYAAAVRYAAQLNYTGVGTVEFLVSGNNFWFLEMNTRIQVEHAVTELITGVDLVEEQIKIAQGKLFSKSIKQAFPVGHSIETRIYAENPYANFQPSAGIVDFLNLPDNVRFDTFIEQGTVITPHFDSLLGKLVVIAPDRTEAIEVLKSKLADTKIYGVKTNLSYLNQLIRYPDYVDNTISTTFIDDQHAGIIEKAEHGRKTSDRKWLLAAFLNRYFIRIQSNSKSIWSNIGVNNLNRRLSISIEGEIHDLKLASINPEGFSFEYLNKSITVKCIKSMANQLVCEINGEIKKCFFTDRGDKSFELFGYGSYVYKLSSPNILPMASAFMKKEMANEQEEVNQIRSPLFGKVISMKVKINDRVKKGDVLLTIESMKTENNILSPGNGMIDEVIVAEGSQVAENSILIKMRSID